ncbi:Crp/Fnr family transcriptional regulator [cf. Phormidesmis sp. LEGE 11477]|uniref:Crp/Fnr family transcriptional regulator n=1 Tax=cf. Phormidesmis sp. LEGE 11477 TaxID=1828680 RepID=UPI001D14B27B|nr:Crp/Fnr family transcriptional regulator [cf. Phormidesmis sp. LEGE 11477]
MSLPALPLPVSPEAFRDLFPLFSNASPETLETLYKGATFNECPAGRTVLMEDSWGNAVYLIVSGWAKVRVQSGSGYVTLVILGKGEYFGEMAILNESPRSTDVAALSRVELVSIPAQLFLKSLFQDPQLHHRLLQSMVERLKQTQKRFQLRHKAPGIKMVFTLLGLADAYGEQRGEAVEIFNIPDADLAAIADIKQAEVTKIIGKLVARNWVAVDSAQSVIRLLDINSLKKLSQLG